jgi:peptide-methionine (R)-S-oxide reductase
MTEKVKKTEAEWRAQLSPAQYHVMREKGTEPAFTGQYWDEHAPGTYVCAGCGEPLFDATTKFDSGTGWPSFFKPIDDKSVETKSDRSHFMVRTEALCGKCEAHLGHVFEDGPEPTGLRFCMNSASLKLMPKKE